jgi:hypothetical protein
MASARSWRELGVIPTLPVRSPRARAARTPLRAVLLALPAACPLLLLGGCDTFDLRPGATSVFQFWQETTPAEAAEMAVDPFNADRRYKGTIALAGQPFAGDEIYMRLFIDNARDEDAAVRAAATRALGNHGGPEHAPLVLENLTHPDAIVRAEAARSLQRLHAPEAVEPLIRVIALDRANAPAELDADTRAEAALALGQYRQERVLQALIRSLVDPQLSVNRNARESLRTLTGQDFGYDQRAWLAWADATREPFAAGRVYQYAYYWRDKRWYEYLPLVPQPKVERPGVPAGLSPVVTEADLAITPPAEGASPAQPSPTPAAPTPAPR